MKEIVKKSFFLAALLIIANVFVARAQSKSLYVYRNGIVEYTQAVTDVDSITFATPKPHESVQVVIKELYNGGVQKVGEEGTGAFNNDQYVVLYNNSNQMASLENLALGYLLPNNSQASNAYYVGGSPTPYYEAEGWVPAGWAIWAFRGNVPLAPGEQIVVAIQKAIDNTATYSNSINFDNPAYYALYDPTAFVNATSYPEPAAAIPASHYLKGYKFAGLVSTAWGLSVTSPAFIIFKTEGVTPEEFAADAAANAVPDLVATLPGRKVPVEWVVDGVEVYAQNPGTGTNKKRLTPAIDSGFIELTNAQGHTLYRNVDQAATEAIATNAGKLVTGYTADPSGIDAEASIKNGARIIYKDTNNSTVDFHERNKASLRD
ncbi:MAG: DUF4876 domain-containing protein [Candidatus Symbiothrix sp.]|jgi:hypothetical protein|nr:DUF4876 domain-containing protein [Candidatus Symbiothrix sp.]